MAYTAYVFGPPRDLTALQSRTGNGVSDYVISGLDLTGATSLQFEVKYGNFAHVEPVHGPEIQDFGYNNAGKELFFLADGNAPQVLGPATLVLLGTGLGVLSLWRRKK